MAFDFPNNPTLGQVFGSYVWNGTAWTGIGSANNLGVQVGQLRTASPIAVANQAARDALYPLPVQGNSVFRNDLGGIETYLSSTVTVNGTPTVVSGWSRTGGLVPIQPSSIVVATGTATVNSLGVVTFTGATSLSLNNVFSSNYQNYRIVTTAYGFTATTDTFFRLRSSGTDKSTSSYTESGLAATNTALSNNYRGGATNAMAFWSTSQLTSASIRDLYRPFVTDYTQWTNTSVSGNAFMVNHSGTQAENASYDGFTYYIASGVFSGTVQVFGYND